MSEDKSYYLGTHDIELRRLGLQHAVWRSTVLEAWHTAGITRGSRVLDAGAGPGYASLDLADVVGRRGEVIAFERSERFLNHLAAIAQRNELSQLTPHLGDLETDEVPFADLDFIWVRWVFAFLTDPMAALSKLAACLKPGGRMVIFEYLDWGAMTWMPENPDMEVFRDIMIADWRHSGGEIDIAKRLIPGLSDHGLRPVSITPHLRVVTPQDFFWQWTETFLVPHAHSLAERGVATEAMAQAYEAGYKALAENPNASMTTPLVAQIIAEKI